MSTFYTFIYNTQHVLYATQGVSSDRDGSLYSRYFAPMSVSVEINEAICQY